MDILFDFLEKKYETLNLKFCKSNSEFKMSNSYYSFKFKKINDKYILSRFWKKGLLSIFFKKEVNNMNNIYTEIQNFAKINNLYVEDLNLHSMIA